MSNRIYYIAVPVEEELPPIGSTVTVLISDRIQVQAHLRDHLPQYNKFKFAAVKGFNDTEPDYAWWTLAGRVGSRVEAHKKCVTHWLKQVPEAELINHFRFK